MKKDRNTFFNESGFQQTYGSTMPNYGMPNNYTMNGGFGQQSTQSFYAGPMNPGMMQQQTTTGNDYISDIESRMAKIERQINRLDARISKLESKGVLTTENFDNTTNMYML